MQRASGAKQIQKLEKNVYTRFYGLGSVGSGVFQADAAVGSERSYLQEWIYKNYLFYQNNFSSFKKKLNFIYFQKR